MTLRSELEKVMQMGHEIPTLKALSDFVEVATVFLRDHGPALLEAVACQEAITEQAMVTECVSVTGRDPSDVIRDIIVWHVQMHTIGRINPMSCREFADAIQAARGDA